MRKRRAIRKPTTNTKKAIADEKDGNQTQFEWAKTHTSKSWVAMDCWGDAQEGYEALIEWRQSLKEPLDAEQKQIFSEALLGLNRLTQIKEMLLEPLPLNEVANELLNDVADEALEKISAELFNEVEDQLLADKEMRTASAKFLTLSLTEKNLTEKEIQAGYKDAMMLADDVLKKHPNASLSCYLTWLKLAITAFEKTPDEKGKGKGKGKGKNEKNIIYCAINGRFNVILEKIKNSHSKKDFLSLADIVTSWGDTFKDQDYTKLQRWFEAAITCYILYIENEPKNSGQLYEYYNDIAGISKLLWHYSPEKEPSYLNAAILWFKKTIDQKTSGAATFKHIVSQAEVALAEIYYLQDRSSDQTLTAFLNILNDSEFDFSVCPKEKVHVLLGSIYLKRNCFDDAEIQYSNALEIKKNKGGIYAENTIIEESLTEMRNMKNAILTTIQSLILKTAYAIENFNPKLDYSDYHDNLGKSLIMFPNYYESRCLRGYLYALSREDILASVQYESALTQALTYSNQGKPQLALTVYRFIVKNSVKNSDIQNLALKKVKETLTQIIAAPSGTPYTNGHPAVLFPKNTSSSRETKQQVTASV